MTNNHNYKFNRGLVIGKFYPPHRGHKFLIDSASKQCEELTVIVCWKPSETIPGIIRAQWLKQIHPNINVISIEDNKLADDDSEGWAKFTLDILGFVPDAVFTSEDYGQAYAKFLGSVHVMVDRDRTIIPISATLVRSNPDKYAQFLEPCVRGYFAKRVCVVGAESTGTTTLAQDLAEYYDTTWSPEYGRLYSEGKYKAKNPQWDDDEFVDIAKNQVELEDRMAERSNGLVICDTDAFATRLWEERYTGHIDPEVDKLAESREHKLYIVTGDEIPFVQDGLRDGEHIRHQMHQRFIEELDKTHRKYIVVRGDKQDRLKAAVGAITQLA